jgi:hypothetical protein
MRRPFAKYRPIGPFNEMLGFAQSEDNVAYTMFFISPGVPTTGSAPQAAIDGLKHNVGMVLYKEFNLTEDQYYMETSEFSVSDLRNDGKSLLVQLMNVDMNDSDALEAEEVVADKLDEIVRGDVDSTTFVGDFFGSEKAEEL